MDKQIEDFLSKRTAFLDLLEKDIAKNLQLHSDIENTVKSLTTSRGQVKELSKQPEHTALIPLCKKLYMPGAVVHTGEFLVSKKAYPNTYSVLKTLDQAVKDLDGLIMHHRGELERADLAITQLTDRKKVLLGQTDKDIVAEQQFTEDTENQALSREVEAMPEEIRSEKGVAVKVGGFFEIMEYEAGN